MAGIKLKKNSVILEVMVLSGFESFFDLEIRFVPSKSPDRVKEVFYVVISDIKTVKK